VVTFLSASSFQQLSDLLPSFGLLHWLESALWLLVRELKVSRGMQKHWLDVLPHTRVQCVVKCEFCISFVSNSLYLFQFNESVDYLAGELCAEWEALNETFILMCGEYDRLNTCLDTRTVRQIVGFLHKSTNVEFSIRPCRNILRRSHCSIQGGCTQDRQFTYRFKVEMRSCRAKARGIAYSECVSVFLIIQHSMRIRRITLSHVACPAVHCFSALFDRDIISENSYWI